MLGADMGTAMPGGPPLPGSGRGCGGGVIFAVVNKGRYLSRANLDRILSDVAAAYAALPQEQDLSKAIDPTHVH